ncbi:MULTISPECIES: hypothetical protein [Actinoalloteichus]|uniref:Uncharacterized protein n=1 Tax=Actinoalloteichus fjordicus TaxID=1612552 RepID=A0AAC9PQ20_9PSEU|nr:MULTISPECIES: hypothetical protein [Actinoalloteichus]APU12487.1 hypothetical protein UA74_02000 [Actinoalloteichus fjordicus]APU18440.1 hypothetical protein UA75_02005 [Actinoalloteichus sp. GBA129-24]
MTPPDDIAARLRAALSGLRSHELRDIHRHLTRNLRPFLDQLDADSGDPGLHSTSALFTEGPQASGPATDQDHVPESGAGGGPVCAGSGDDRPSLPGLGDTDLVNADLLNAEAGNAEIIDTDGAEAGDVHANTRAAGTGRVETERPPDSRERFLRGGRPGGPGAPDRPDRREPTGQDRQPAGRGQPQRCADGAPQAVPPTAMSCGRRSGGLVTTPVEDGLGTPVGSAGEERRAAAGGDRGRCRRTAILPR